MGELLPPPLVALLAYAVSTGTPDLQLRVQFDRSSPNNPAFEADTLPNGWLGAKTFPNLGKVLLRNNSGYSAKNPAAIVRLHGMLFTSRDPGSFEREWASMEIADMQELDPILDVLAEEGLLDVHMYMNGLTVVQ